MGDRTAVAVEIGGKLDRAHFAELVEAIEAEGLGLEWGDDPPTAEELLAALKPGEPLRLMQSETYADIGEIGNVCAKAGLFWRMCWDAYPGSYSAGAEMYDQDGAAEYVTNGTDGEVLLYAHEIRQLGSWDAVVARLARLTRPLPAFELTGDWPEESADD